MEENDNKKEEILELPDIPDGIKQAINNRSLVIFVGAGASAQVGMPLWNTLADNILDECYNNGYINDGDRDLLKTKLTDNKEKLSVAFKYFEQDNNEGSFYDLIEEALEPNVELIEGAGIYDFCKYINARVITTNADLFIDKYYEEELIGHNIDEMNKLLKKQPVLLKIHGSIKNRDSLVFRTSDYIDRYRNPVFKELLGIIFNKNNTILFLGYGLGEFELLEFVLEKTDTPNNILSLMVITRMR